MAVSFVTGGIFCDAPRLFVVVGSILKKTSVAYYVAILLDLTVTRHIQFEIFDCYTRE